MYQDFGSGGHVLVRVLEDGTQDFGSSLASGAVSNDTAVVVIGSPSNQIDGQSSIGSLAAYVLVQPYSNCVQNPIA